MTDNTELNEVLDALATLDAALDLAPDGSFQQRELLKAKHRIDMELAENTELKVALMEANTAREKVWQAKDDAAAAAEH